VNDNLKYSEMKNGKSQMENGKCSFLFNPSAFIL